MTVQNKPDLKGWLVKQVYPVLRGDIQSSGDVKSFLSNIDTNIKDCLEWEASNFAHAINPCVDPVPSKYYTTPHPEILLKQPRRRNNTMFYTCPSCMGRLFRGTRYCPFCGKSPASLIELDRKSMLPEKTPQSGPTLITSSLLTYTNFIEYLYPQYTKPSITPILTSLRQESVGGAISKGELNGILKILDRYLPDNSISKPKSTKKGRKSK